MSSKSIGLVDPRALSEFLAMFVTEAYEVVISNSDAEVMTRQRLIEYSNDTLSENLDDDNLPEKFRKIAENGGVERAEDAIEIAEWNGDQVAKIIIIPKR